MWGDHSGLFPAGLSGLFTVCEVVMVLSQSVRYLCLCAGKALGTLSQQSLHRMHLPVKGKSDHGRAAALLSGTKSPPVSLLLLPCYLSLPGDHAVISSLCNLFLSPHVLVCNPFEFSLVNHAPPSCCCGNKLGLQQASQVFIRKAVLL